MDCLVIFDNFNDVVFAKYNLKFSERLRKLGVSQGFISSELNDDSLGDGTNLLIQLFSPLLTSQHVMSSQFSNSYSSVQCENGTNMVFDEYLEFLFIGIGFDPVLELHHMLKIFISFVKHICGADIAELKRSERRRLVLNRLLDTWSDLRRNEQGFFVEALEQLYVNPEVTRTAINALSDACTSISWLQTSYNCSRSHGLIFVDTKLLATYSSREAEALVPSDILFLNIFANTYNDVSNDKEPSSSNNQGNTNCVTRMADELLLLKSKRAYVPHAVHLSNFGNGVTVMILYQICHDSLCTAFEDVFSALINFNKIVNNEDRDVEAQKRPFENVENAIKRIFESFKKIKKNPEVEPLLKQFHKKWDLIKRRYCECLKNGEDIGVNLSANITSLLTLLKQFYRSLCLTVIADLPVKHETVSPFLEKVHQSLVEFIDFIKAKSDLNFSLQSKGILTINKYLEEFPGLVHFLYIDRTDHRVTAPIFHFSSDETNILIKRKIWEMVTWNRNYILDGQFTMTWSETGFFYHYFLWFEDLQGKPLIPNVKELNVFKSTLPSPGILADDFYKGIIGTCFPKKKDKIWEMVEWSRSHIQDGHLTFMWKDTTFNYSYFLWFQDLSGTALKPKINPMNVLKTLSVPGILAKNFYKGLIDGCFPKMSSKVRCFELYCIHLGLATSSIVLDQSRRIAATVWEVTGRELNNPNVENLIKI